MSSYDSYDWLLALTVSAGIIFLALAVLAAALIADHLWRCRRDRNNRVIRRSRFWGWA